MDACPSEYYKKKKPSQSSGTPITPHIRTRTLSPQPTARTLNAVDAKDVLMFKPGTAPPEVLEQSQWLNVAAPLVEITQFASKWFLVWKQKWAAHVRVPVMFPLVDNDPFSVSTKKEVECCVRAFENSIRVDGNLIMGAPHCVELTHWSQGWYARCFGFALECSASFSSMAQGSSI